MRSCTGRDAGCAIVTFIVDRISFELMRDLGIRKAFAFDQDFVAQGFELVTA